MAIAVDLDGTLAEHYSGKFDPAKIGPPIPRMTQRVKRWLADGMDVVIFTARVAASNEKDDLQAIRKRIEDWTEEHLGKRLEVTSEKRPDFSEIWDDRAVQVIRNTGIPVLERDWLASPIEQYATKAAGTKARID